MISKADKGMFNGGKVKRFFTIISVVTGIALINGCGQVSLSAKTVEIELGSTASLNVLDYVYTEDEEKEVSEKAELDLSEVDTLHIGKYSAKVTYRGKEIAVPVTVVDSTPPSIQIKEIEFKAGDQISANDLVDVSDFSETELSILDDETETEHIILRHGIVITIKAVDEAGNETIVDVQPKIANVEIEASSTDRVYNGFLDFPYDKMCFVDEEAYEFLKNAYAEIEWYSEFEKGDLTQYNFYKEKYKKLVENEEKFFNPETGDELYLNDFAPIKVLNENADELTYDKNLYTYYYFDIDEDGVPELCLSDKRFIFIFKYEANQDKFVLWKDLGSTYYSLNGSMSVRWENGSGNTLYKLDENGEEVYSVTFWTRGFYNEKTEQDEVAYLMKFPYYSNESLQLEITDEIERQGYYIYGEMIPYFKVTEEQYDELTEDFYQAKQLATQEIQKVTYTYDELFGE